MKMSDAFPSKWVQASDLKGDTPVTISAVMMEEIGNPPKHLPVVYFTHSEKGFVLNKTNSNTITGLFGNDDTDIWIGKQVTLYPTVTSFNGEMKPCIRVRSLIEVANMQAQSGQTPVPPADMPPTPPVDSYDEDEIPF